MKYKDLLSLTLNENRIFLDTTKFQILVVNWVRDNRFCYICHVGSERAGWIFANQEGNEIHIYSIAVKFNYQSKKVGSGLINKLFTEVYKQVGRNVVIKLQVNVTNQRAIKLYEQMGFVIKEQFQDCYFDHSSGYIMINSNWYSKIEEVSNKEI